jgi:hypothetical protein
MLSLPKQSLFCYIHYVDASQCFVSVSLMSWGSCFPARIFYWGQWLKMLAFVSIVSRWLNITLDYLHWICIETEVVTFSQSLILCWNYVSYRISISWKTKTFWRYFPQVSGEWFLLDI